MVDEETRELRESRKRKGCRRLFIFLGIVTLILIIAGIVGYRYTGSEGFADYVRRKIELTLEAKLDRDVSIGVVTISRGRNSIVLEDVRISNVEGTLEPYFAIIPRVVIEGGIESFRTRTIRVGTVTVERPTVWIEIFPEEFELTHNIPSWKRAEPRGFQISRVELDQILLEGGRLDFLDRRRDMHFDVRGVASTVTADVDEGLYEGTVTSGPSTFEFPNLEPFHLALVSGFSYADQRLEIRDGSARGRGLSVGFDGAFDPIREVVYSFDLAGQLELDRVREIVAIEKELHGGVDFEGTLEGRSGDFELVTRVSSAGLVADTYDLASLEGTLSVTPEGARFDIEQAGYGGGTVEGQYELTQLSDPLPMNIDLRFRDVSIEKLFADWNVENTGLRGRATGTFAHAWNGTDFLGGEGSGSATLAAGARAFGNAPYPIAVSGGTEFTIRQGVLGLRNARFQTPESVIRTTGTIGLDGLVADLDYTIESDDFAELDRLAVNFSRSLGTGEAELLGLGGTGSIRGTVDGAIAEALVTARIEASGARYNDAPLGRASIDLVWNGARDLLRFERSRFVRNDGTLAMSGTIGFPEGGAPRFDLAIDAAGWDVAEALDLVDLDLDVAGIGTGRLLVVGTPESGTVTMDELTIREDSSRLVLGGTVQWLPGEGNLAFDLDIAAETFPVSRLVAFLDLGDIPVDGLLTGTLHIEGPKEELEGAGSVTIRQALIAGEPVEQVTADLVFDSGTLNVEHLELRSAAGTIIGQASYSFDGDRISWTIQPTVIDLSEIEALADFRDVISGKLRIQSTGAGTAEQPEIVVDAVLEEGSIGGVPIPAGVEPPSLYLAIRGGELVVRGTAFDAVAIEGSGFVGTGGELSGDVTLAVTDLQQVLRILAPASEVPVSGAFTADLALGGSLGDGLDSVVIDGAFTTFAVNISGEDVVTTRPLTFQIAGGDLLLNEVELRTAETNFYVDGRIPLSTNEPMNLTLRGSIDAALAQLFVPDSRISGNLVVRADIGGAILSPRISGTVEVQNGSLRLETFPQTISDIFGTILFRGNRIELDAMRATLGGGQIIAGGFVTHENFRPGRIRLTAQGDAVTIRYYEGLTVEGDFDLVLSGDDERMVLQGSLDVTEGQYYKDVELATTIVEKLLSRQAVVPRVSASWQDNIALEVDVNAPGTLSVANNIANVTASADLTLTGTLGNPVLLGRVVLDEGGEITFRDIDYTVVQGTITFQNPFRNDPYFDISAEGLMRARGQALGDVEEYELTINLTGTLDQITPSISSEPPLGDLTLLTLLAGDVGSGSAGGFGSQTFTAAGTSLLLSTVGEAIGSRILPFADALRVESVGENGSFAPTVTFEKQIADDLYAIIIYDTSSAENIQIIQWEASRNWVIQFTRDSEDDNRYVITAVDGRFRRRYPGHW
ncbi:MAG: translocation/assembly module TamB domain-containing protein [Acidobacteria bacterium]|nr:translocation/assembly module TamB domain-containing protein [Acidobacteriota bacterium]